MYNIDMYASILSFVLRILSAASKFFLVSYLGVTLTPDNLGKFAHFATIVVVFTQVAGLEINQTLGRRIHGITRRARIEYFSQHIVLVLFSYVALSSIVLFFYYSSFSGFWCLALPIFYLEHITTELYRYRIQLLMPIRAALCIFLKNAWIFIFIPLDFFAVFSEFDLGEIFIFWLVSLILSLAIAMPMVRLSEVVEFFHQRIGLLRRSVLLLRQSIWLIWSAFFVTLVGVFDKLFIERTLDLPSLGEYYFYQTLASAPAMLVSFTLMMSAWPKCVRLSALGELELYIEARRALGKSMFRILLLGSLMVIIVAVFAEVFVDTWNVNFLLLAALLASSAFFSLCDVQKLDLYTCHDDLALFLGNFFHAIIVVSAIFVGSYFLRNHLAISIGAMGANMVVLVLYWLNAPRNISRFMRRLVQ